MHSFAKNIIVVDDDIDILECVQAMLEDVGYNVITAARGEEVATLQEGMLPDLILLDMLLSGEDGREIARHLKSQAHTRHIPIVMLSAHPSASKEARASGADDFLAKPFEIDDLLEKVARYVG